ncbi:hypothetical protein [Duganella sp. sic0402]|uniref:hypothetical protein n=1 Tax=Duganella sp. sic0402 TaxID=2854786 RepID=UPI0035A393BC
MAVQDVMRAPRFVSGALLAFACGCAAAQSVPSTFGTIVGNGLLCRDHTDNIYFYNYFVKHFGNWYKHEGGAYWFRTAGASLWGTEISEVMVSDDTSTFIFVGAVAEAKPEDLEKAIIRQAGTHYTVIDTSPYPVREAKPASRIVYFDTKSKIYCAKFKPLPPTQPAPVRQLK